jgi:MFS family permease
MPVRTIVTVWPLFFGLSLIGLAVGVQGSLLGVRAEQEGFPDMLIGLLMSCYFAGFLAGSLLAPRLISQVGHIRIFGALAAIASVTILIHALYVEPWTWAAMRFLTGFAFSSIYVVSESWLNQAASNENRGRILAIYMTILLAGVCAGQFLLDLAPPKDFTLFILISVMVSVAAVPILVTRLPAPEQEDNERVTIGHLWYRAPMGVIGIVLSQWLASAVFGMGAVYAAKLEFEITEIAYFMAAIMAGGMLLQWPLGRISDCVDRRWVMGAACIVAAIAALAASGERDASIRLYLLLFLFGGFCLSLYSLVVALTNDHLRPHEIVPASGTIILIGGIASIIGPLSVTASLQAFGTESFFQLLAVGLLLLASISIYRVLTIPALPPEYKTVSSLQAAPVPVGTLLHAEDELPLDNNDNGAAPVDSLGGVENGKSFADAEPAP